MIHLPRNLVIIVRKAYEPPYIEAIEDTKSLLEEIVQLVERQFLQMDMTLVYCRLAYTRIAHNVNARVDFPEESPE